MTRPMLALAAAACFALPVVSLAQTNPNQEPQTSAAQRPEGAEASPGTVGAMNNKPMSKSFKASKKKQKKMKMQ